MNHPYSPRRLFGFCMMLTAGCAQLAVQPPTPAKHMDVSGMWDPRPKEHFYITLFGSQSTPRIPRLTHSWGTAIHVVDQPDGEAPFVESHTISWLPATMEVHPWRFRVEKGVNASLHETLAYAMAHDERISQWGPYECRPELYYRFLVQKEFLETGRVGYQAIDTVGEAARNGNGCDCIHAMTDMDPEFSRNRYPLIRSGDSASRFAARECRRRDVLINPDKTYCWLNSYLGIECYPIIHRD